MKIIWEDNDISAGLRVRKPGVREAWIVGYDPGAAGCANFAIISLTDGMIASKGLTSAGVAAFLNDSEHQPVILIGEAEG